MDEPDLQQVAFRFGSDTEVRYMGQIPKTGDFIAHNGELWVIIQVAIDTVGWTIICEPTSATTRLPNTSQ